MFRAFDTGFQLDFDNGLTASVAFGSLNYCDRRGFTDEQLKASEGCKNAEIAVWETNSVKGIFPRDYVVKECGWNTSEEVSLALVAVSGFKPHNSTYDELRSLIKSITNT